MLNWFPDARLVGAEGAPAAGRTRARGACPSL